VGRARRRQLAEFVGQDTSYAETVNPSTGAQAVSRVRIYCKPTAKPIFQLLYSSLGQVGGSDQDARGSLGDLSVQTMRSASLRIRRCLPAVGREMPTVSAISPVLS
jgi:hypothetical protein